MRTAPFAGFGPYPQQDVLAADYRLLLTSQPTGKHYQYVNSWRVNYDASGTSAADNYRAHAVEMAFIWQETVPRWAQELLVKYLPWPMQLVTD